MRLNLGYVAICLVRDELDVKYYVNLWENELKGIYYRGDYHMGSPDLKVKQFVCCFCCLMSAMVCSIVVLLWAGSSIAQMSGGWEKSRGSLLLAGYLKPPFPFP